MDHMELFILHIYLYHYKKHSYLIWMHLHMSEWIGVDIKLIFTSIHSNTYRLEVI
jgi:hypothetical protein